MSRVPSLSSPFLLGFDEIERALDRVVKGADGYPRTTSNGANAATAIPKSCASHWRWLDSPAINSMSQLRKINW